MVNLLENYFAACSHFFRRCPEPANWYFLGWLLESIVHCYPLELSVLLL